MRHFFTKYWGVILLLGALSVGLRTYKSYGISFDEGAVRYLGIVSYNYAFHGDDTLQHFQSRDHGVGFELPLLLLEKVLRLTDSRDIALMRHLANHIFFLLGAFAFFLLIDYIYKNKLLATLGFLLIVVNPLLYGHSFFNTKDIPFMSVFIICFLLTTIAFKENKLKWYVLLGIGCGFLTSIRVMGILLIGCIWGFFVLDTFLSKADKASKKKTLYYLLTFTLVSFAVLYAFWPFLYPNPIKNFIYSFKVMAKYPWHGYILFFGTTYPSAEVPLYYGIAWFCISNPVTYLILGLFGIIYFIIRFIKKPLPFILDKELRMQSLFLFCFAETLISVLILHSILYDAWRQLYFIYPPFILVGLFGLNSILKTKAKLPVLIILFSSIGYTAFYMTTNFPHEHVYFNELVKNKHEPEYLRKNFELDYWGTSILQGLDYIVKNDTAKTINVAVSATLLGEENTGLLKPEDRKRINIINDISKSDYYITFYRRHPEDYPFQKQEVFSEKVLNSTLMSVFKKPRGE